MNNTRRHFASFGFNRQQKRCNASNDGCCTVQRQSHVNGHTQQHLLRRTDYIAPTSDTITITPPKERLTKDFVRRSGMNHTVLPAITPIPAFIS